MASATEAELGGLLENYQKAPSMQTNLKEIGQSQPPTTAVTYNTSENRIMNGTENQKNIQSNRHDILLGTQHNMTK